MRNGLTEKADVAILGDKIERIAADIQPADNDKVYDCGARRFYYRMFNAQPCSCTRLYG